MSRAISAHHGAFGRACLYELDRPMAMHAHREGHMIFHVKGSDCHCHVAGSRHGLRADRAVSVSPWELHDFRFDASGEKAVLLVLYIDPSWFEQVAGVSDGAFRFGRSAIDVPGITTSRVNRIVRLLAHPDDSAPDLDLELQALTQNCHELSWQGLRYPLRPSDSDLWSRDHRIRKTISLMKQRVANVVNLNEIAADSGLSRPHFYRLFRESLGITPNVYLNTLRMELAIDRLIKTDQQVTSIGLDLGFASQASFTRFFAANVGIPPTNYRRAAHCA